MNTLKEKEQEQFFNDMFPVMEKNMDRLYEDISYRSSRDIKCVSV